MRKVHITESQLRKFVKECAIKTMNEVRNKRGILNEFYRFVHPFTQKRFHDNAWQNVRYILNQIGNWADEINVHVENGGYGKSADGMSSYKDWQIELVKDGVQFEGYLRACACGTMEDEWDAYDVVIIIW